MSTQQTQRKEIVQLNGLTILVIMALLADFLVVGFIYRYHSHQIFLEEKKHNLDMTKYQDEQEHNLKLEIEKLEGVKSWNETNYMRSSILGGEQ